MSLNLRTQILLFLFLFAFTPLLLAVVINLPLVLDRVALFYRHAFLQDLRADFRDLDQHLASRDEMLRLLAKLPEPGVLMAGGDEPDDQRIAAARRSYVEWINRILSDQLDIHRIQFIDPQGEQRFWLERSIDDGRWESTITAPPPPAASLLARVLASSQQLVMPSPIQIQADAPHPSREMAIQLLAPIVNEAGDLRLGAVVMTIDVGGLVRRDPATLWVHGDGRYLRLVGMPQRPESAFADFPGLEEKLVGEQIALWESGERQVIWVPLFRTDDGQALWVGRDVDLAPLNEFQTTLVVRVLSIIVLLVAAIWFGARLIARRAEQLGQRILDAVRRMLEDEEAVEFNWGGSRELHQLGASLTQLAATHARDRRNLRAHARELEESSRYKSEFLANVSHELRTPLNSILLLSKLLDEELAAADADTRQKIQVIRDASLDLRELIDDVLDLSRIEAGRMELSVEDVDLPALLEDLADLLRPQFEQKGLDLRCEVQDDVVRVIRSDPAKLRQILKNFLGNAVKFTRQGGVSIRLLPTQKPFQVRIEVTDTGIGIPADKHALVFEAFRQADGSTGRHYGGTGLGLTISRELVRLLGGEIGLESEPGRGSTFYVRLPGEPGSRVAESPAEDAANGVSTRHEADVPQLLFEHKHALLVGGNVQSQIDCGRELSALGLGFVMVDDPEEMGEVLDEQAIAFVIIDAAQFEVAGGERIPDQLLALGERAPVSLVVTEDSEAAVALAPAMPWANAVVPRAGLRQNLIELRERAGEGP